MSFLTLYCLTTADHFLGSTLCQRCTNGTLNLKKKHSGRLHVSTKQLFFQSNETQNIFFFTLTDITNVSLEGSSGIATLQFSCTTVREGFQDGIVTPLVASSDTGPWHFEFRSDCDDDRQGDFFDALKAALITRSTDKHLMWREMDLLSASRAGLFCFPARRLVPLREQRGVLHITERYLEFIPLYPVGNHGVVHVKIANLGHLFPRTILFQDTGLDLYNHAGMVVLSLSFFSSAERKNALEMLCKQCNLRTWDAAPLSMLEKWQKRQISNYEYLLYLNKLASRSFDDLSQYPVFPWVLQRYDLDDVDLGDSRNYRDFSKPAGALNKEKLDQLIARSKSVAEMEEHTYLFPTHYSSSGGVAYYCLRSHPEYMLSLQHGKLDRPQRMFESICGAWASVLTNGADEKELIPEFFNADFEELAQYSRLPLGTKDSGDEVSRTLLLPAWAKGTTEQFIRVHTAALESEYVSSHLHLWIDLIFGAKQDGSAAAEAFNTFHPYCYPQAKDARATSSSTHAAIASEYAKEFGAVPAKLFYTAHPSRDAGCDRRSGDHTYIGLTAYTNQFAFTGEATAVEVAPTICLEPDVPRASEAAKETSSATPVDVPSFTYRLEEVKTFATGIMEAKFVGIFAPHRSAAPTSRSTTACVIVRADGLCVSLFDCATGERMRVFPDFRRPIELLLCVDTVALLVTEQCTFILDVSTQAIVDTVYDMLDSRVHCGRYDACHGLLSLADVEGCLLVWIHKRGHPVAAALRQAPAIINDIPGGVSAVGKGSKNSVVCANESGEVFLVDSNGTVLLFVVSMAMNDSLLGVQMEGDSVVVVFLSSRVQCFTSDGSLLKEIALLTCSASFFADRVPLFSLLCGKGDTAVAAIYKDQAIHYVHTGARPLPRWLCILDRQLVQYFDDGRFKIDQLMLN